MTSKLSHIGKNIKFFRKQRKLTQEQLAERSGLSVKYISLLETGASNNITVQKLAKIAGALNTNLSTIVKKEFDAEQNDNPYLELLNNKLSELPLQDSIILCQYFITTLDTFNNLKHQ